MNVEKEKFVYNFYPIFRQIESFKILNFSQKSDMNLSNFLKIIFKVFKNLNFYNNVYETSMKMSS